MGGSAASYRGTQATLVCLPLPWQVVAAKGAARAVDQQLLLSLQYHGYLVQRPIKGVDYHPGGLLQSGKFFNGKCHSVLSPFCMPVLRAAVHQAPWCIAVTVPAVNNSPVFSTSSPVWCRLNLVYAPLVCRARHTKVSTRGQSESGELAGFGPVQ